MTKVCRCLSFRCVVLYSCLFFFFLSLADEMKLLINNKNGADCGVCCVKADVAQCDRWASPRMPTRVLLLRSTQRPAGGRQLVTQRVHLLLLQSALQSSRARGYGASSACGAPRQPRLSPRDDQRRHGQAYAVKKRWCPNVRAGRPWCPVTDDL